MSKMVLDDERHVASCVFGYSDFDEELRVNLELGFGSADIWMSRLVPMEFTLSTETEVIGRFTGSECNQTIETRGFKHG